VDWTIDIGAARQRVGAQVALQGNLDPAVLAASPDAIRAQAHTVLDAFGDHPGHVFNLGHGITPDIDPANVAVLVDAVHGHRHAGR
jgi:uroporphyrinogen decarboxylase